MKFGLVSQISVKFQKPTEGLQLLHEFWGLHCFLFWDAIQESQKQRRGEKNRHRVEKGKNQGKNASSEGQIVQRPGCPARLLCLRTVPTKVGLTRLKGKIKPTSSPTGCILSNNGTESIAVKRLSASQTDRRIDRQIDRCALVLVFSCYVILLYVSTWFEYYCGFRFCGFRFCACVFFYYIFLRI